MQRVMKEDETEQERSPLHLHEPSPIHPLSMSPRLSHNSPEVRLVPSPASSPRTRNLPQGLQTLENTGPPQLTHLQTAPIPIPQQSEPHPFSPHNPLSHIEDSSLWYLYSAQFCLYVSFAAPMYTSRFDALPAVWFCLFAVASWILWVSTQEMCSNSQPNPMQPHVQWLFQHGLTAYNYTYNWVRCLLHTMLLC